MNRYCATKMKELYLLGKGAFGREVLTLLSEINAASCRLQYEQADIEYLDDDDDSCSWISSMPDNASYVCTVADPRTRRKIITRFPKAMPDTLVHPGVVFDTYGKSHSTIREGSIVCAQVILMPNVKIGKHVHVNTGTHIGHDAVLDDFVTCSGRVHICGNATIGEGAFLSTGAIVLPGVTVGEGSVVGPGCVVHRDMKPNTKCANRGPERTGVAESW